MTTKLRTLAIGAVAATMLIAVPSAQAHGEGQSTATPPAGKGPGIPFAKFCHRAVHNPNLSADQRATVAAACAKLKSDLRAAQAKLEAAKAAARAEVKQALDGAVSACAGTQFNSDACRSAKAAAEQVKRQAMQEVRSAQQQFEQDVRAALNTFKSTLRPIKESLEGGGHGPGKHGPPVGAN